MLGVCYLLSSKKYFKPVNTSSFFELESITKDCHNRELLDCVKFLKVIYTYKYNSKLYQFICYNRTQLTENYIRFSDEHSLRT